MKVNNKPSQINQQRLQSFSKFFKNYMGAAPIIVAALPIPVAAGKIIPIYAEQAGYLTLYTSMFCFLVVSAIFYRRHRLGNYLLPETWDKKSRIFGRFVISWLPLILIIMTLFFIAVYHITLNITVNMFIGHETLKRSQILNTASIGVLDTSTQAILILSYFGIFLAPTAAFALMAVREYMQNVLGLSEKELVIRAGDPFTEKGRALMNVNPNTSIESNCHINEKS